MNKQINNKIVPMLRFPEFRDEGEWEEKILIQISPSIFDGTHQTPTYTNKGIPFFSVENIVSGNKNKYISREDYLIATIKNKPQKGDILITRIGNIGFSVIVDWDYEFSIYVTLAVVKKSDQFDSYFLHCFFQSERYQNEILSKSLLNAVPCKINMDELRTTKVLLPSLPEQKTIASCLFSIDELISAQSQKLDTLKKHKNGLMQQLFPAEGETIPKLRFPEYSDAEGWKKKDLNQLFEIGNGRDYKHLSKGDIPVYGSGGYMLSVDDYLYEGESVCIGRKGTIDKPFFLTGKFWTVDTLFYTHSFKDCLPYFIYLIFQNINWLKHNEAGGIPSLSKTIIGKIEVYIPKPDEQAKIATCLSTLEELITAQSQKIDAIKAHKKGLMQQLFPSNYESDK